MSSQFFSDEQTIDRYNEPTLEHLISENKIKDLALSKATNLIELLNIELEVERNSSQENVRQIQQELKHKYEAEIKKMRDRIEFLERELNRTNSVSNSTEKTLRNTHFVRANSLRSLENRKKRSINKKYTQNQTVESNDKSEIAPLISVKDQYFKQQMLVIEEWKTELVDELDRLVKSEYDELSNLINTIEACGDDFEHFLGKQSKLKRNPFADMSSIVKQQQSIINSLRAYSQDLEDMYKSAIFKLQSLTSFDVSLFQTLEELKTEKTIKQTKKMLVKKKQQWGQEILGLQTQNGELKQILDSMIKLVKEDKRIKK